MFHKNCLKSYTYADNLVITTTFFVLYEYFPIIDYGPNVCTKLDYFIKSTLNQEFLINCGVELRNGDNNFLLQNFSDTV